MDPLTHASLGAAAAIALYAGRHRPKLRLIVLFAVLGALAPDLDVFISSDQDPLLSLEYHRHFTHSLFFVPLGSLIVTALCWPFFQKKISFKIAYIATFLGYLTHPFNDSATNYGTVMLWPFSDTRVSWNIISIVDPLYTLPLLLGVILSTWKAQTRPATIALLYSLLYFGVSKSLHLVALDAQKRIALSRGHTIERGIAHPTLANIIVWRSTYEFERRLYVDAIRVSLFSKNVFWEGGTVDKVQPTDFLDQIPKDSLLFSDLERYQWFSDDFMFFHPEKPDVLGDFRFSLLPQSTLPLWGIRIDLDSPHSRVEKVDFTEARRDRMREFASYVTGRAEGSQRIP